ncbi:MAG: MATE family efflux transporter [Catenisphaera adipataccumulans]|jgi:multidrug efflux pump|uniref:MATE family efflux transporter n=1 Tax=Catenisphaera adipataccumulans TaxID=700500 RepID=UPI003D8D651B
MGQSLEKYDKMTVSQAIFRNALPAVIAMLMTLIYNLADTFFIGQTHDAYQVAAVSLATPVFLVFMAIGTIFGAGGTSVISRAYGEGKHEYAGKVGSFCMWSCIGIGILLTILMLVFMDPLLSWIGASQQTWTYTKTYLTIVSFCGTFSLLSSCFSNIQRAEGQATRAMMGQIIGNLTNMCLDPLFISGFHWGVAGCALATFLGETLGAVYYLQYYVRGKSALDVRLKNFTVQDHVASNVLAIGIPASLGSLLMSVAQIIMNAKMAAYGDMAVAGIGVAMKIVMITGMISMGIGQGVQPLLGYCAGSKNTKRFHAYMRAAMLFATALGIGLTLLCYLFMNPLVSAFLSEPAAFDYAVEFARILLVTGPLFGIFYVMTNALQAMGAATASLIANVSRQGLVYIPMLFVLGSLFQADGLVWAQPAADIVSFLVSIVMYRVVSRKKLQENTNEMVHEPSYAHINR